MNRPRTHDELWNAVHPIGTPVRYWRGLRDGEGQASITRSAAWRLGSGEPVVMVEGCAGGIALTHVEAIETGENAMTELTDTERERLAEPMYAAYRLGKYAPAEYLPMWHELDQKPTSTPEHEELYAVVGDMLAAARAEVARDMRAKIEALPDQMAAVWGGDDPWLTTGNRVAELVRDWLNEALADGGEPQ